MTELENKIYNYPTKYKEGFIQSEIDELLKDYPNINIDRFNDAMMGDTCMYNKEDGIITYHCDIITAIRCGVENRGMTFFEFD